MVGFLRKKFGKKDSENPKKKGINDSLDNYQKKKSSKLKNNPQNINENKTPDNFKRNERNESTKNPKNGDDLHDVELVSKTFRVFVSSTLDDFQVERDALQKKVFPDLKKLCEKEGFSFQAIDLRWGVSTIAQYNQKTMKICLDEIERCQKTTPKPNFIVLLGNRYGWTPIPYEIEKKEFEKILKLVEDKDDEKLLNKWFRLDENAKPPFYVLQVRTDIYTDLSNPKIYKDLSKIKEFISLIEENNQILIEKGIKTDDNDKIIENLKSLIEFVQKEKITEIDINNDSEIINVSKKLKIFFKEFKENKNNTWVDPWDYIENKIIKILQNNILKLYDKGEEKVQKYFTSATEQEIVNGVLEVKDTQDHVFGFFRKIKTDNLKENLKKYKKYPEYWENMKIFFNCDEEGDFNEKNIESLENIKNKLECKIPDNIHYYTPEILKEYYPNKENNDLINNNFLKDFCDDVYTSLSAVISEQIKDFKEDPLKKEINIHDNFAKEKSNHFIGREDIIKEIKDYINSDNDRPLAIVSESGLGKTALLAQLSQIYKKTDKKTVSRFIGATPESSNITSLLKSIVKEIITKYIPHIQMSEEYQEILNKMVPNDYNVLLEEFQNILGLAINKEQLVIFIDAVNQLSEIENPHELAWLPQYLPKNVKIIISTISDDSKKNKVIKAINNKIDEENIKTLHKMNLECGKKLLNSWLDEADRTLTEKQENEIIKKFKISKNPLFLKFAFEEAINWKSYTEHIVLPEKLSKIISHRFEILSKDENHGKELTSKALCYIASARYGLSENELIEILSYDKEVMADYKRRKSQHSPDKDELPFIIWSKLYFDLKPYLIEKDNENVLLINFYHQQINQTIKDIFLKDNKEIFHEKLAEYFEGKPLSNHVLDEYTWQLLQSKNYEKLMETLCDLNYFITLYDKNHEYDILYYWFKIESQSQYTIKDSYKKFVYNLSKFNLNDIYILGMFFMKIGYLMEGNLIYNYITKTIEKLISKDDLNASLDYQLKDYYQASIGNQAILLKNQGRFDEAMELQIEKEKICREIDYKHGLHVALGNQANILLEFGHFDEAMELQKEKEKICHEINDKTSLHISLGNQASILFKLGHFDEAMILYNEQEKICREINNKHGLQASLYNQAIILRREERFDEAMEKLEEQEKICRKIHRKYSLQDSLGEQSFILTELGRFDEAMEKLEKGEKICRELKYQRGLAFSLANQAVILKSLGRFDEAIEKLKEGEKIYEELSYKNNSITL